MTGKLTLPDGRVLVVDDAEWHSDDGELARAAELTWPIRTGPDVGEPGVEELEQARAALGGVVELCDQEEDGDEGVVY